MTEQEVLAAIDKVANVLGPKFRFGYHSNDDMKQYAKLEAIKGIGVFDASKGKLETFLWTHVRNRLSNLKRDQFERIDKPCLNCPLNAYDPYCETSYSECTEYNDKMNCDLYASWFKRNSAKKKIMVPIEMSHVNDEHENNMKVEDDISSKLDQAVVIRLLDEKIPPTHRKTWVKIQNGSKVSKADYAKLASVIKDILETNA